MNAAKYLQGHEKVAWVSSPSLPGDKYYDLAKKYMPNGTCGVITFGLKGGRDAAVRMMDSLKMIAGGKVSTNDIAGPVRIVTIIDQTVEENTQYGFVTVVMNLLNLMVMFSANLGVMTCYRSRRLTRTAGILTLGTRHETAGEPESRRAR